jgi:hypothetical protein
MKKSSPGPGPSSSSSLLILVHFETEESRPSQLHNIIITILEYNSISKGFMFKRDLVLKIRHQLLQPN